MKLWCGYFVDTVFPILNYIHKCLLVKAVLQNEVLKFLWLYNFFYNFTKRVTAFHVYVLKSLPSAIRTRNRAVMADQAIFVVFKLLFLHALWCLLRPYSLSNIKYRYIILSDNSFPSAHLWAHHEKKMFFECDACPNPKFFQRPR